jgi:hypothetical protein
VGGFTGDREIAEIGEIGSQGDQEITEGRRSVHREIEDQFTGKSKISSQGDRRDQEWTELSRVAHRA